MFSFISQRFHFSNTEKLLARLQETLENRFDIVDLTADLPVDEIF